MSTDLPSSKSFRHLRLNDVWELIKDAFNGFLEEKGLHHGAALAYYALFALVPMLYLSITYVGRLIGQDMMIRVIGDVLKNKVGITDVKGIIEFLSSLDFERGNFFLEFTSVIALLIACSAFLVCLKNSINAFFDIELNFASKRKKIVRSILFRLISILGVTLFTGLIVSLYFAQTVVISFGHHMFDQKEWLSLLFFNIAKHGFSLLSNLIIFSIVFKYVHDGVVSWKLAIGGALVTSILLYLGQLLIKYYLFHFFFAASGGLAGTLFIILAWVYYSSQIIFFGAKFTAAYAKYMGRPIQFKH
jgi:membrane protein